ncbi:hypothetical protein T07_674 [Trichinella nelsoni]|uniref:Uncharacterized protein n=1 Tax=Trichinella nelsoni TaxID=6336 RepID=A0A0V0RMU3_9BILA|nr:hypothetical protein T07_674 [Trichinella nelsoni]
MILTATSDSAETVHRNDSCRALLGERCSSQKRDEDRQGAVTQREDAFNISIVIILNSNKVITPDNITQLSHINL